MSSYFDAVAREIAAGVDRYSGCPGDAQREVAMEIERRVVSDVSMICGDREFPDDYRQPIMSIVAIWQMHPRYGMPSERGIKYFDVVKASRMIVLLHEAFHEVAASRTETRFGILTDDPADDIKRRDQHDTANT